MRRIHPAEAQTAAPRRRWLAAALVCAATALAGLAAPALPLLAAAASGSPDPLIYRIGTTEECDGVNPFAASSPVSRECLRLGYDFLTRYDADYRPVPDIAESWVVSGDGTTWTFRVREGMTWHDGIPLTAHDVAFTYGLILKTQAPAYAHHLAGVRSVTAPDDATVVIVTRRPRADLLGMAVPILPEHVWEDVEPDALDVVENQPFVGSGPFRIEDVQSASVRLAAHDAYPDALGGRPSLDELDFVVERDVDALVEAYTAGSLDAVASYPPAYAAVLDATPGTTTVAAPAIGLHELAFNCWHSRRSGGDPLLLDPSVRRAVHWAIDKEKLVAAATAGLTVPGTSLLSPAQLDWRWEVPEAAQYRYDPERAKRILEDAGYADRDGDGVREDAEGRPLSFRLAALTEHPEDQLAARMIVRWCRDVGLDLRLEVRDEADFSEDLHSADYDALIRSRDGAVDPGFILDTFTTARIGDGSETRYSDPLYDSLYVGQVEALDPMDPGDTTRRKNITDAMQKLLYRDDPSIVLWYRANLQAFRTDTWTGYALAPQGAGAPFWNRLVATYVALRPLRAPTPEPQAPAILPWVAAGALAVAGAGGVLWLRRRCRAGDGR
jgi:peptide/nickel transport system substrate-binding protein